MIRIEHNVETGEIIEIEMTPAEIKAHEDQLAASAQKENEREAARQAVLDKLGLTADEVAALLG